ncbi:MAG TPA: hypothetical protein VGH01_12310 [Jatrophihabitantaceae bacterium]
MQTVDRVAPGTGVRDASVASGQTGTQPANRSFAQSLSREWLAIGAADTDVRSFAALCAVFAAVLWGQLVRGAFFRLDLTVFTSFAVFGAVVMPHARAAVRTPWLIASAGSMALAVGVSAIARDQLGAALCPLAAIAAASSLAVVGICASQRTERLLFGRVVVDAAVVTGVLCIVGVALHVPAFAELQAEGWRASARIGYANATGVVLVTGLLCACWLAYESGALGDRLRAWAIMTGLLATQSRGAVLGLAICWLLYLVVHRASARILAQTTAWALVAFVGLIPAIERSHAQPVYALCGIGLALILLIITSTGMSARSVQLIAVSVGWSAAVTTVVLLNTRVADSGSDSGRLRLWHEALGHLSATGVFGAGPSQLASFSNGRINQLFDHNDLLQYGQYYGVLGVLAVALTVAWLAVAFTRTRRVVMAGMWVLGVAAVVSLACDAMVDFPMQVPLIPATVGLVLGLTLGRGRGVDATADLHHREGNAL